MASGLLASPALSQVQWDCCFYGSRIVGGRSPQPQSVRVVSLTRLLCVKDALCAGRCPGAADPPPTPGIFLPPSLSNDDLRCL